jgi:hypothetical protein
MSAEKDTLRRVQDGLFHLQKGISPFVEMRMKSKHGQKWLHYASRTTGGSPNDQLDTYGLLKTMIDQWRDVFDDGFTRNEKHRVRSFLTTAFDARNATSHLTLPLQDEEALRYLDAIHQLMRAAKAPEKETAELKKLYEEQRRAGISGPEALASPPPVPAPAPPVVFDGNDDKPSKTLQSWIDVALPHPDVLANRFKEAEFAADLFAVDSGNASDDYLSPQNFFRITFLTEGLRRVLTSSLERIAGTGGDPVIGLQTAFGGGKTHTMLAVFHLAKATMLDVLEGVPALATAAGIKSWNQPKLAVFVGTAKGPDSSLVLKDGPRVNTVWGYIAWRLAGERGFKLMAEAEAARTNPGSELLVELFKLAGPSVILLDELVAYARQLPDDRFEAFLSFIQSLTEAAKMVPGVLVIGSLPESDAEAGRDKGKTALLRLEKIFGRVQSAWLPASGNETYEIIRRRLFQALDADGERARDETVRAFADMYRKSAAEFPPEAKEPRYAELLRVSYPIHPELFDRLSKDWASLEKFQRTRGVLRLMANVVSVLWQEQAKHPLIMPARVPVAHERVRASVLYPLDQGFAAVVDKEVDGDGSLPARMEVNPSRRISQARAATRAARAVFMCTAPLVGQPNAGLNGLGLRLACAEPGDQLAIFGEALRELSERATYLYEESGRYWFSTQPTLNRLADDRAKALPDHEVDEAIKAILREDGTSKARFHRVFAVPDDPTAIDDVQSLSLVIIGPSAPHSGKGVAKSMATDAVADTLTRCRSSQRRFRNTLLFVAADETQLGEARTAVRRALAWESILEDKRVRAQLTDAQAADAKEKAKSGRDGAVKAVRGAWNHILFPEKPEGTEAGTPFVLDHLPLTSKDRAGVPTAVYEKASGDGIAKEKLGGEAIWLHLKPLWPEEKPHLLVNEIADWFASYVYLPKLRDRTVLELSIRDALAKLDPNFAYADRYDEGTGKYVGLLWQKAPSDGTQLSGVLVRPDIALVQLRPATPPPSPPGTVVDEERPAKDTTGPHAPSTAPSRPSPKAQPKRFYGSVEIDMVRPVKAFDAILNAVVMELQRTNGSKVKITVEIQATAPEGFSDADVGVVRDNAKQLKFSDNSTGFDDED